MKPHVFISYPEENQALVENFAECLRELGIVVWVYSLHRTLAVDLWQRSNRGSARRGVFVFVASTHTRDAAGQHRELKLALDRIATVKTGLLAVPLVVDDLSFQALPPELRHTNGLRIDVYTVKSTAMEFARGLFRSSSSLSRGGIGRPRSRDSGWKSARSTPPQKSTSNLATRCIFGGSVPSACLSVTRLASTGSFGSRRATSG